MSRSVWTACAFTAAFPETQTVTVRFPTNSTSQPRSSRREEALINHFNPDLAQAVHADPGIKSRLRIYSIGSWNTRNGERERDYLFTQHPDLWWIENDTTFRGMYMGGEQDGDLGNRSFPEQHIREHGALGALFMRKKADIKMGDTPSVLYLLDGNPDQPETHHWGGAFIRPDPDQRPTYWHDNPSAELMFNDKPGAVTVNQWRKEYLRDWQERMNRVMKSGSRD